MGSNLPGRNGFQQLEQALVETVHNSTTFQVRAFVAERVGAEFVTLVGVIMNDRRAMRVFFNDPETTGEGRSGLPKLVLEPLGVDAGPGTDGGRYRIGKLPEGSSDR